MPLETLLWTRKHFVPEFNAWIELWPDHRNAARIRYSKQHLVWEEMLMFLTGVGSRNAMVTESETEGMARTLQALSGGSEECAAHPDTPYVFLQDLPPKYLIELQAKIIKRLIRMRCLERFRFGAEWLVAIDATWLRTYKRRHCKHCLTQELADGTTRYMHAVLEAKLVLANGMVFSLASVPIQNAGKKINKQDCELKAFHRLTKKLKTLYPRLPMCLLMDSLYCCEPVMETCRKRSWSYITVFKEGKIPTLWSKAVKQASKGQSETITQSDGTIQNFTWASNLKYGSEVTHAIFCSETKPDGTTTQWAWISDHRPDKHWAPIIANKGGRLRWKIENEGFNAQKNGEIGLKHDYGSKKNAWYNDYLIVQIVHVLVQLIQFGDLTKKLSKGAFETFGQAFRTLRCFVARLRESVQRDHLAEGLLTDQLPTIQIRLNSS